MIERLHRSSILDKLLGALQKSGQKGEMAVSQCLWLIEQIRNGQIMNDDVFCKRTKKGEYRVTNCVKYDLGNGYRLVTIRNGKDLYVPFIGGHDETDKWLDRRKHDKYIPNDPNYHTETILSLQGQKLDNSIADVASVEDDIYEKNLQQRLDETTLRQIFSGFYKKQHQTSHN